MEKKKKKKTQEEEREIFFFFSGASLVFLSHLTEMGVVGFLVFFSAPCLVSRGGGTGAVERTLYLIFELQKNARNFYGRI